MIFSRSAVQFVCLCPIIFDVSQMRDVSLSWSLSTLSVMLQECSFAEVQQRLSLPEMTSLESPFLAVHLSFGATSPWNRTLQDSWTTSGLRPQSLGPITPDTLASDEQCSSSSQIEHLLFKNRSFCTVLVSFGLLHNNERRLCYYSVRQVNYTCNRER